MRAIPIIGFVAILLGPTACQGGQAKANPKLPALVKGNNQFALNLNLERKLA